MSERAGPFELSRSEQVEETEFAAEAECRANTLICSAVGQSSTTEEAYIPPPRNSQRTYGKIVSIFSRTDSKDSSQADTTLDEEPLFVPIRKYECKNYNTCLSLAAALDWCSFTCNNCTGCVNKQLLWRAHHALRTNSTARTICKLPEIS